MRKVAIGGAGLAGCLAAISLARRGYHIDVYERRPDCRRGRGDVGRSINLSLSARGAMALTAIGLADEVLGRSVPMRARAIHAVSGEISYHPYGRDDSAYFSSIDRHALHTVLLDAIEQHDNIRLHFNQRLAGIDFSTMRLTLVNDVSHNTRHAECESLVGTDGAYSFVRKAMIDNGIAQFDACDLAYGYKELPIAAERGRDLRHDVLHLWPRRSLLLMAHPNPDYSFSCTLFMPHAGTKSFARLKAAKDLVLVFKQCFPDAYERMPAVADDFFSHSTSRISTVQGGPWYFEDKLVLLGDAAHALAPFFAQGMNSAFEDCTILLDCLDRSHDSWAQALPDFFAVRKADADAISTMAIQNYRELQDDIADDYFLFKKRVEQELMRRFPGTYTSMHTYVAFTGVRYAFAQACGALQTALLDTICSGLTTLDQVDWTNIEPHVTRYGNEVRRLARLFKVDFRHAGLAPG